MALNSFSDVLRHAVENGFKTEYTELMLQAAELLDAKNTRPAAPVEGLETIEYMSPVRGGWVRHPVIAGGQAVVTRSQAEAIIAAKDAKIADLENELSSFRSSFKEQTSLKANNAALTARVKELSKHVEELQEKNNAETCACSYDAAGDACKGHSPTVKALETQLATARKALTEIYGNGDATGCNPQIKVDIARAALEGRP